MEAVSQALQDRGQAWWVLRLSNMSTIMREWSALHSWHHVPFAHSLLACAADAKQGSAQPASIPQVQPVMPATKEHAEDTAELVQRWCRVMTSEQTLHHACVSHGSSFGNHAQTTFACRH